MKHVFSMVPKAEIPRSRFNRDHTHKFTMKAGVLVPFLWDRVYPGDTFNVRTSIFARMATLISPIMDDLWLDTHYFFVPSRLVWDNFQKFMGEQIDPDDSIDYVEPQMFSSNANPATCQVESVCDYFGLPLGQFYSGRSGYLNVSALPFRAYCLIWDEWFRDENLQDSIKINRGDQGLASSSQPNGSFLSSGSCLPRNKRHDYFTSALPWPQKPLNGSVSISATIPLNGVANVFGNGKALGITDGTYYGGMHDWAGDSNPDLGVEENFYGLDVGSTVESARGGFNSSKAIGVVSKLQAGSSPANSGLVADLTTATGATINELRQAFQVQRFLEKCARQGTRYTEIIRGMFGTVSPDARLQRPEYLGGTSSRIDVNVVPQTSSSADGVTPQANLAAFATGANKRGDGFTKSFVEHGFIIGLVSIRGPLIYQQGLNRQFSYKTRFDYYWPTFAHLGEQAVLNKEIYAQGTSSDDEVFGYQERYAEMRYFPSMVSGKFRSTYAQPLDSWHLAQKFDSLPTLSDQFIRENPPIERVIAVQNESQFLVDAYIKMDCARPMPLYGVPGLIDHF